MLGAIPNQTDKSSPDWAVQRSSRMAAATENGRLVCIGSGADVRPNSLPKRFWCWLLIDRVVQPGQNRCCNLTRLFGKQGMACIRDPYSRNAARKFTFQNVDGVLWRSY